MWNIAQGKHGETLALFECTPGEKDIVLTEENYLHYFAEWRNALLAAGDYTTSFDFLTAVFTSDDCSPILKLFACNDLLRLCTLTGQNADMAHQCLDFLKQFYADCPRGRHTVQTVNNIVFASLELGDAVSPGFSYLVEEFSVKKDIEEARCLIASEEGIQAARRLVAKISKHCTKTLQGYVQTVESLLGKW